MENFKQSYILNLCVQADCPYEKWDVVICNFTTGIIIKIKPDTRDTSICTIYTKPLESRLDYWKLRIKVLYWNLIGKI